MRAKIGTVAAVAVLVAAAFFLPELLLSWGDGQSLDVLRMESQDAERGGFAESIQLTVPEKIMLLRSGAMTVMELDRMVVEGSAAGGESNVTVLLSGGEDAGEPFGLKEAAGDEDYAAEASRLWETRLASARGEIWSLQTMGGLPDLWKADSAPDYTGYGDLLYLDPDTYISFQAYQFSLHWEGRSLDLLVDAQSDRILSFSLQWSQGGHPNWGLGGAAAFGSAWRDYWKMDSVSTGWYNEYTRTVLESVEAQAAVNGDYAARSQVTFMYDSQSLSIPVECQGSRARTFSIAWNR